MLHKSRFFIFQGKYKEAEPLYKRYLAVVEKTRGPNHPDVVASLDDLAYLLQAQVSLVR